jgi:hypothetical protein
MTLFIKSKTIAQKLKIIRIFKPIFFAFLEPIFKPVEGYFLAFITKKHLNTKIKKADSDLLLVSLIILRFDSGLLLQWCHFQT